MDTNLDQIKEAAIKQEEEFNALYAEYPKKVKMLAALMKFNEMTFKKKLPPTQVLIDAVKKQKNSTQWQTQQFIPNLDSWLAGHRWLDELPMKTDEEIEQNNMKTDCDKKIEWAEKNGWSKADIMFADFGEAYRKATGANNDMP